MGQSIERKIRALYFEKTGALSNLQVRELVPLIEAGKVTPPRLETLPLEQAPAAYEKIAAKTAKEKQVILF